MEDLELNLDNDNLNECLIILIQEEITDPEKLKRVFKIVKSLCADLEENKKDNLY